MHIWPIRRLPARTAAESSFSQRMNRLSTRKRALKMNHKDAQTAEEQENSKEIITTTEAEASETDGKNKEGG
jgi:hypothetical protein